MEDALIIEKFASESTREEAFKLLLNKYQQKIYWHVRRMVLDHDDADDVVQDIFIKVWRYFVKIILCYLTYFYNKRKKKS